MHEATEDSDNPLALNVRSEHLYIPPFLIVAGLLSSFWLVVNLCTSVRLRDNLCSKYLCHMTYAETTRMLIAAIDFWGIGLSGNSMLNTHAKVCTFVVTIINGLSLATVTHIIMISGLRAVHMYNPAWLKSQRSSVTHYSIFMIVVGMIISFVFLIHADIYKNLRFGGFRGHKNLTPEDLQTAMFTIVPGLQRKCQASFIDSQGLYTICTVILFLEDIVLLVLLALQSRLPDNHQTIYRHYKSLNWVIILRGVIYNATKGIPGIFLDSIRNTISPSAYTTFQYIELIDPILPHWVFLVLLPSYRREALATGCRYMRREPPIEEDFSSYEDLKAQEVDPEFSSSHGDLLRQHQLMINENL